MNQKAINDFILFSEQSLYYGLIDNMIFLERMITLYNILDIESEIVYSEFPEYAHQHYKKLLEIDSEEVDNEIIHSKELRFIDMHKDSNILHLYQTNVKGKKCKWEFYESDADPYPSVPHGHGIQETKLRLDPYRRIIFKKQKSLEKINYEDKKFIKALWNDDNFRDYARRAINNFISSGKVGKNYNWKGIRGILNPLRLPKKKV